MTTLPTDFNNKLISVFLNQQKYLSGCTKKRRILFPLLISYLIIAKLKLHSEFISEVFIPCKSCRYWMCANFLYNSCNDYIYKHLIV